jgi:hypothetical protein
MERWMLSVRPSTRTLRVRAQGEAISFNAMN